MLELPLTQLTFRRAQSHKLLLSPQAGSTAGSSWHQAQPPELAAGSPDLTLGRERSWHPTRRSTLQTGEAEGVRLRLEPERSGEWKSTCPELGTGTPARVLPHRGLALAIGTIPAPGDPVPTPAARRLWRELRGSPCFQVSMVVRLRRIK